MALLLVLEDECAGEVGFAFCGAQLRCEVGEIGEGMEGLGSVAVFVWADLLQVRAGEQ